MYYKVAKTSESGRKIEQVRVLLSDHLKAQKALASKYGFKEWQIATPGRQIVNVRFENGFTPDPKLWRLSKNSDGYVPITRSKAGKELREELRKPQIWPDDINGAVGIVDEWSTIGIAWGNEEWFGIDIPEDMEFSPPSDMVEITSSEYKMIVKPEP